MKKIGSQLILFLLLIVHPLTSNAWGINVIALTKSIVSQGHFYLGGTISTVSTYLDKVHPQVTYPNIAVDEYELLDAKTNAVSLGINGGVEFEIPCFMPRIALGLAYADIWNSAYDGQFTRTLANNSSNSNDYQYRFHVNAKYALLETKLTWVFDQIAPFTHAGIGKAWNRVYHYSETPLDNNNNPAWPPFQSHTESEFAYQIGFGLAMLFNYGEPFFTSAAYKHERLAAGYRYTNLGNTSFATRGANYNAAVSFGQLSSNELYLSYTHFF